MLRKFSCIVVCMLWMMTTVQGADNQRIDSNEELTVTPVSMENISETPAQFVVTTTGEAIVYTINGLISNLTELPNDINKDGVVNVGDLAIVYYFYGADEDSNASDMMKMANVVRSSDSTKGELIDISDLEEVAKEIFQISRKE